MQKFFKIKQLNKKIHFICNINICRTYQDLKTKEKIVRNNNNQLTINTDLGAEIMKKSGKIIILNSILNELNSKNITAKFIIPFEKFH